MMFILALAAALAAVSSAVSAEGPFDTFASGSGVGSFCKTENNNGVSWLSCPTVAPGPILTIGANHVSNDCRGPGVSPLRASATAPYEFLPDVCMTWDSGINASAYREATLALHGSDKAWAASTASRLRGWGFNTAGAWSSVELENQTGLLFTVMLDMGVNWTQTVERLFPDVFDPAWKAHVEAVAERECAPRRNNPRLLGYFPDNELNWEGRWPASGATISHSLLTWFLLRPAGTPGLGAATSFLQGRYGGSIDKLNAAWGTHAGSWAALGAAAPYPAPATPARASDENAFLTLVADTYHNLTSAAIRRADPNHLVLGYRSYGPILEPLARACGKHFDIADYHAYSATAPVQELEALRNASGLPVMVSEFGFRASDSGLPNTRGAGPVVMTQTERAAGYQSYITDIVKLPYLVGFHTFAWVDEPAAGNGWAENSNYGMVHLDDSEYPVMTKMYSSINAKVAEIHAGK